MIICIEREGTKQCSWWWNNKCNNNHVPIEIRIVCDGKLPRLAKEINNVKT